MPGTGIGHLGRRRRLAVAQRAYGALPPEQRRVLVLRYVDGVEPAAIAARLGTTEPEVRDLIAAARGDLLRTTRPEVARPLALTAVLAALALTAVTRVATPPDATQYAKAPSAQGVTPVVGGEAFVPVDRGVAGPAAGDVRGLGLVDGSVPDQLDPGARDPRPPVRTCAAVCAPRTPKSGDTVRILLPQPVSETIGTQELVFEQEHVPVCESVPTAPAGAARCVPGSS